LKDFPVNQVLSRCKEGKKRNLYFTSKLVKNIVENNADNVKIINTGVRILCRSENKDAKCSFRFTQEGISTMLPFLNSRIYDIERDDIVILLTNEYPAHTLFSKDFQDRLSGVESGCVVLCYTGNKGADDEFKIELCGWKGNQTIRCYVPKVGRAHYLRIVGYDVTEYEMREKKKFKVKDLDSATGEISDGEPSEEVQDIILPSDIQDLDLNSNTEEYGHDAQGAYKCDVFNCIYATRKASALAAHKMRTHGKKEVFPCSYCGEVFTLSDTRNKHIKRKHTQEKSYQCAICDKKFFTKQELDNHFNSRHTCSQKLKCANCDLTFTTIRTLNVHQKKQHGIKQFKCEKCELSFAYRYELHNHRCKKLKELTSLVTDKTIMPLNLGLYGLPSNATPTTYHGFDLSFNVTALPVN